VLFFIDSRLPKAIFIAGIALTVVLKSFSQAYTPKDSLTTEYYLQKSKSQKIAGFILLGVGVTTLAILSKGETDFDVLPVLAIGGLAATVISVPLFISAGKNKRKAISLSVKKEKTFLLRNGGFTQRSFPALSVKFNVGH
jgi:hypothetical protein